MSGRDTAARRIQLSVALAWWDYVQIQDPYGERSTPPADEYCIGRQWFMCDAKERIPVVLDVVRRCHPNLEDTEWDALLRAAAERERRGHPTAGVDQ